MAFQLIVGFFWIEWTEVMSECFGLRLFCRLWCLSEVLVVLSGLGVEDNTCVEIVFALNCFLKLSEFEKLFR